MNRNKSKLTKPQQGDNSDFVYLQCHGPALKPLEEKCILSQSAEATGWAKIGYHRVPAKGDGASYNGIRTWRCPTCFTEHRRRISETKNK